MITGYCMQTEERPGVIYDYSGCLYPEGVIRSDVTSVFNHDQIEKIDFVIFSAFIIASTIFAIVVLILWLFFGLELTVWQLSTVIIWIAFVFAGLTL